MSKNRKRFFDHLKQEGRQKKKSKHQRARDRNDKRALLDLLMELNLYPEPKRGGWISFNCPECCEEQSAVLNCNILEFYCSGCREIGTVPQLIVSAKNLGIRQRGMKIEFKKNGNVNARSITEQAKGSPRKGEAGF